MGTRSGWNRLLDFDKIQQAGRQSVRMLAIMQPPHRFIFYGVLVIVN
jgi:hypothetical protein